MWSKKYPKSPEHDENPRKKRNSAVIY